MSITGSYRYCQQKMHEVLPNSELKFRDEVLKALIKESPTFPSEEDDDSRDEEVESPTKYETLTDTKSEYTKKKLHRIKRRLFLDAVNSSHAEATRKDERNCGSVKTRGRE